MYVSCMLTSRLNQEDTPGCLILANDAVDFQSAGPWVPHNFSYDYWITWQFVIYLHYLKQCEKILAFILNSFCTFIQIHKGI